MQGNLFKWPILKINEGVGTLSFLIGYVSELPQPQHEYVHSMFPVCSHNHRHFSDLPDIGYAVDMNTVTTESIIVILPICSKF